MNEELKSRLDALPKLTRDSVYRAETAKAALEKFDATTRNAVKSGGIPAGWAKAPTDDDAKSLVLAAPGRDALVAERIATNADAEAAETEVKAVLAKVSLVCSETAAMSRIAGQ